MVSLRMPPVRLTAVVLTLSLTLLFHDVSLVDAKTSRVSGARVLYEFKRSDCLAGYIPNVQSSTIMPNITLNSTMLCNPAGNGLQNVVQRPQRGQRAITGYMGSFADELADDEKTVEVWLKMTESIPTSYNTRDRNYPIIFAQDNYNVLSMWQQYRTMGWADSGSAWFSDSLPVPAYVHFVMSSDITLTDDEARFPMKNNWIYINGEYVTNAGFEQLWASNTRLWLFSGPTNIWGTRAWQGEIHLISIYDRGLSAAEIKQNYDAGLPNSEPVVYSSTVTVQQNGEVGTHSSDPYFYLSEVPVLQLANLTVLASDLDWDPTHPNYNASAPALKVYVASLPSKGTLYHLDGTPITRAPALLSASDCASSDRYCRVRFRPAWQETSWPSVYTTFTYYAVDGTTGKRSSTGTMSVIVTATHRPPTPKDVAVTAKAGRFQLVTLNGTATDGVGISSVNLASLPSQGQLYQVYANGSVATGARLSSIGTALWTMRVAYVYTGRQDLPVSSDNLLNSDSFTFTVTDGSGYVSVSAKASIEVQPALSTATPTTTRTSIRQGRESIFTMSGYDHSSSKRDLCVEVVTVPTAGALYQSSSGSGAALQAGEALKSVIKYPYTSTASVYYKAGSTYFNSPNSTYGGAALSTPTEGFSFRVRDCNSTATTSATMTQTVTIVNVNDPTGVDMSGTTSKPLVFSGNDKKLMTGWTLSGVAISDPDRGVDPVKAEVSVSKATCKLNLNPDVSTSQFAYLNRDTSRSVVRATPSVLSELLDGASVACLRTAGGVAVNVTVKVYDGQGGSCLPASAFTSYSNRTAGCLTTTKSFQLSASSTKSGGFKFDPTNKIVVIAIAVGASVFLLCFCCCIVLCMRCRRSRGGYMAQNTPKAAVVTPGVSASDGLLFFPRGGDEDVVLVSPAGPRTPTPRPVVDPSNVRLGLV